MRVSLTADEALSALRDHAGPVLLDLDETAYLRNSTEDFLDSVRPRLLAWLVLKALDVLKPWKRLGGEVVRDTIRVRVILLLFPWALSLYERRVNELAKRHANQELLAAATSRGREPYVVTLGYEPIVRPLVRALGLRTDRLVACSLDTRDRTLGKLPLAERALPEGVVGESAFVTDSEMDRDLLSACKVPLLVRFANARYVRALSDVYVPGRYLNEVKRPGERYIWRGIIQDDFAFWLLASMWVGRQFLLPIALGFLLLSFWAAYEVGYMENDRLGEKFEDAPKLSEQFLTRGAEEPKLLPWLWVAASGVLGVYVSQLELTFASGAHLAWLGTEAGFAKGLGAWFLLIAGVRALFWLYNRVDKITRVWLFLGLQFARAFAFAVVIPVSAAGALGLSAHTIARWVPYYGYRYGKEWSGAPTGLSRLVLFLALSGGIAFGFGTAFLKEPTWIAFGLWMAIRARRELHAAFGGARRIDGAHA